MTTQSIDDNHDGCKPPVVMELMLDQDGSNGRFLACLLLWEPGVGPWHLHIVNSVFGLMAELYKDGSPPPTGKRWTALQRVAIEAYYAALAEAGESGEVAA